jgi:hypothetical protein
MSTAFPIPPRTLERLKNPVPQGQRHTEIIKIAIGLISARLPVEAVFHAIRPHFGADMPDAEIWEAVKWAESRFASAPAPAFRSFTGRNRPFAAHQNAPNPSGTAPFRPSSAPETPERAVERFLNGFRCEEADLWERSPIRPPDSRKADAETLLSALFGPEDRINIVSARSLSGGKPHPTGTGTTRSRNEWLAEITRNGPPYGPAGAWIRPNPVKGSGIADADVSAFRFLLIESDALPIADQTAFFGRLPLPIAAIISSGGKSLHAWVKVDAPDLAKFRTIAVRIYNALSPYGIDPANKNSSRLSRLPGVPREEGGVGDKRQKLLYLNPHPTERRIVG